MNPQQWPILRFSRVNPRLSRNSCYRHFSTSTPRPYRPLDVLHDGSVNTFRQTSFTPEQPAILPRSHFRSLPATTRWFDPSDQGPSPLNPEYLRAHGADAVVPLELTEQPTETTDELSFRHFHAPLSLFLDWLHLVEASPQSTRLYLAQCQLLDLPPILCQDLPTPDIVGQAGRGDVYNTNLWIGYPPTYTPLHRDPNPNLFVQLAGQKVVRLLPPMEGQALFGSVRRELGKSGNREAAAFRGEEMMQGGERALLDQMVWDTPAEKGYEALLGAGDGLFIPKGWWHSIKGIGEGVTASVSGDDLFGCLEFTNLFQVNWWFR
jgi:hypothetical protein